MSATELQPEAPEAGESRPGISRGLVALLAVACGTTVANLYYAQPLLSDIARGLGVGDARAGLLVTVSQVSYACGLVLLVPLGDLVDRRRLVARLLVVCAVTLGLAAIAPGFAVLAIALAVASLCSVVVQILIPLASTLALESERGAVVGMVMSGVITGILLARTVSGIVAGALGWRAPFAVAAVLMALLLVALWRALPAIGPTVSMPYRSLLASVGRLVVAEPALRRRMLYGACGFAGFSCVWTTIAFLLSAAPFHYHAFTIGLFGLVGAISALGVSRLGALADRGLGRPFTGLTLAVVVASWVVLMVGGHTVAGVIVGLVLLDAAAQGQNVLSQHVIYGLGAENASRVTTAYVSGNFLGGAVGSAAGSVAWELGGWSAVCVVGGVIALVPLLFWLTEPGLLRGVRGSRGAAGA